MGSTQMYSLSWGEFGSSLASTVQVLRGHGELIDVTLAAGGRIFPAHKLVLSAASPLLMELLKSTGCQHPVVMLAGVTAHDLEALLQFMYNGEVSVDPSQLPSFLQAAHCLDIQALSPSTLTSEKLMCQSMTVGSDDGMTRDDNNSLLPVRKRKRRRRVSENGLPNKWPHMESIGTDSVENISGSAMPLTDSKEEQSGSAEENSLIPAKKLVSDQPVECSICGVVLKQSRNLRRHMMLIHMKFPEGRTRKTRKHVELIKKETTLDTSNTSENLASSHSTILRSVPDAALQYNVGLLSTASIYEISPPASTLMSQPNSHQRQTTPPVLATCEQEVHKETEIISQPSTSTSLSDNLNSQTFLQTSMQHTINFVNDSLLRQQSSELMRNGNLYCNGNITDTREHCTND